MLGRGLANGKPRLWVGNQTQLFRVELAFDLWSNSKAILVHFSPKIKPAAALFGFVLTLALRRLFLVLWPASLDLGMSNVLFQPALVGFRMDLPNV